MTYSPLYLSFLSWVAIVITNFFISIALGETQTVPSFNMVLVYQLAYTITGVTGFWFVLYGVQYVENTVAGLLSPLEAVFGVAFGILIFHESVTLGIVVGGVLIIFVALLPHVYVLTHVLQKRPVS